MLGFSTGSELEHRLTEILFLQRTRMNGNAQTAKSFVTMMIITFDRERQCAGELVTVKALLHTMYHTVPAEWFSI